MRTSSFLSVFLLLLTVGWWPGTAGATTLADTSVPQGPTMESTGLCAQIAVLETEDASLDAANTFTVVGDSWGFLYYGKLRETFVANGESYDFKMRAIPGTTAEQWADIPCLLGAINSIIRDDKGTPTVLISLGGNDFVNDYSDLGVAIYERIAADLSFIVSTLVAERSDVRIVFSGYDVLNFDKSQKCRDMALNLVGSTDPAVVNPYLAELNLVQEDVAAGFVQAYLADVAGALQGAPGNPDLSVWSPLRYFVFYPLWQEDCIHMSFRGYGVFTGAIYDWFVDNGLSAGVAP